MTRTEHLLVKLMEESAEVTQRCAKVLRFGLLEIQPAKEGQPANENNSDRLVGELLDLFAVVQMLERCGAVNLGSVNVGDVSNGDILAARRARVENYLAYSKECGTLE